MSRRTRSLGVRGVVIVLLVAAASPFAPAMPSATAQSAATGGGPWGGDAWVPVTSPALGQGVVAVSCPMRSRCLALVFNGANPMTVAASTDGGATWATASTLPAGDPFHILECTRGTTHCIASPDWMGKTPYVSDDLGETWRQAGTTVDVNRVSCPSVERCVAFLGTASWSGDGGRTWQKSVDPHLVWTGDCPTPTHCVSVGGGVGTSDDGGLTWTSRSPDLPGSPVGVSCATTLDCVALVQVGPSGTQSMSGRSTDGGVTWTQGAVFGAGGQAVSIDCVSALRCVAKVVGGTFVTDDGGSSWVAVAPGTQYGMHAVSCADPDVCVVVNGAAGVLTSGAPVNPAPADLPSAPDAPTAVVAGDTATVSWSAPASAGSGPVTGYRVTSSTGTSVATGPSATSAAVAGLAPAAPVTFTVTAMNLDGLGATSPPSDAVLPSASVPAAPTVVASGGDGAIRVEVSPSPSTGGSAPTDVVVQVEPGGHVVDLGTGRSTTVTGLPNDIAHTVTATVANVHGTSLPGSASPVYPTAGPPHLDATVTAGDGMAAIAWQPVAPGPAPIGAYVVEACNGTSFSLPPTSTAAVVPGLTNGTPCSVRVRSVRPTFPYTWFSDYSGRTVTPQAGRSFGSLFHASSPTRILDSRAALGGFGGPVGPGQVKDLLVAGSGPVPATAKAVVLNVTATDATAASYLTAFATGTTRPGTASVLFGAGATVSTAVVVPVGAGGKISFFNQSGTASVVADLTGWFDDGVAYGDAYTAQNLVRMLDSRSPAIGGWPGPLGAGQTRAATITAPPALGDRPPTSVVVNVTVTNATRGSYLRLWRHGAPAPDTATILFGANQTVSNLAVLPVGPDGKVDVYNQLGSVQVILDLVGLYAPAYGDADETRFHPVTPTRVLDDRVGIGVSGPWGPNQTRWVPVTGGGIPGSASGIVASVTITNPTTATYVGAGSSTAMLSAGAGQTVTNLGFLAANSDFSLYNQRGWTDLVADATGWFASG